MTKFIPKPRLEQEAEIGEDKEHVPDWYITYMTGKTAW